MDNSYKITVRPAVLSDCQQYYEWESAKEVTEFFSIHDGQTYDEVVTEFVLNQADPEKEQYTIVREDGKLLGRIYLGSINRNLDSLEIFRIYIGDTAERGKGYGRQALEWCLDRAFRQDTFHRVYLDYYTGNPSQYLYESIGFQHVGLARGACKGACKKMGQYHDVNVMDMIRDDYENLHIHRELW